MNLEFKSLEFSLPNGKKIIVKGQVSHHECIFIRGPSGIGKTTLFRTLVGLHSAEGGALLLNKRDITYEVPQKRRIGLVFQGGALWDHMTVMQNLLWAFEFCPRIQNMTPSARKSWAEENLSFLNLLGLRDQKPAQLSGGEKSRVALLRTLLLDFELYLFDEPLAGLDPENKLKCAELIRRRLSETSAAALVVSHIEDEKNKLATRELIWESQQKCIVF